MDNDEKHNINELSTALTWHGQLDRSHYILYWASVFSLGAFAFVILDNVLIFTPIFVHLTKFGIVIATVVNLFVLSKKRMAAAGLSWLVPIVAALCQLYMYITVDGLSNFSISVPFDAAAIMYRYVWLMFGTACLAQIFMFAVPNYALDENDNDE